MLTSRRSLLAMSTVVAAGAGASIVRNQGDGPRSDADALQMRYDTLVKAGGGTLSLPAGTIRTSLNLHSRLVHLRGAGRTATVLQSVDSTRPVLQAQYADAAWDAVTISDLTVAGQGQRGIGFGHDPDQRALHSGRTILRNVRFQDLETCVVRPNGNIGLWLEDCQFEDAAYHIRGTSAAWNGQVMHGGVLVARQCHFQRATAAVVNLRSEVPGSGQVTFEECLFENNPGSVIVLERFESREGVPGVTLRSCWNEANATGGRDHRLTVDGQEYDPVFLFAKDVAAIELHDTPPGKTVLIGETSLTTRASALDMFEVVLADRSATIAHHEARLFGGRTIAGTTHSLTNANLKNEGPTGGFFHLLPRAMVSRTAVAGANDTNACRAPILLRGTRNIQTRPAADAILPGEERSQDIFLDTKDHVFLNALDTLAPDQFVLWTFAYRWLGGDAPELQVTGDAALSTVTSLARSDWSTLGGIALARTRIKSLGFWLRAEGAGQIRIGGYQLLCFPTRQAATDMLNARLFVERPASS